MYFDLLTVYSLPSLLIPLLLVVLLWIAVAHPHRIRWAWLFRVALSMVVLALVLLPAFLTWIAIMGLGNAATMLDTSLRRPNLQTDLFRLYLATGAGAYFCIALLLAISSLRWDAGGDPHQRLTR